MYSRPLFFGVVIDLVSDLHYDGIDEQFSSPFLRGGYRSTEMIQGAQVGTVLVPFSSGWLSIIWKSVINFSYLKGSRPLFFGVVIDPWDYQKQCKNIKGSRPLFFGVVIDPDFYVVGYKKLNGSRPLFFGVVIDLSNGEIIQMNAMVLVPFSSGWLSIKLFL